ncbi:unnamed protein product [Urochloa humidicola]
MEMEREAGQTIAMLQARDSAGMYQDVVETISRWRDKMRRLVQIVTCRHSDDTISARREGPSRERPPRPPSSARGRGAHMDRSFHTAALHPEVPGSSAWHEPTLPRTPAAPSAGPSSVHEANISTPPAGFQ